MEAVAAAGARGKVEDVSLPKRTADTMSDAIALSSPSGKISKRARRVAEEKLSKALFGDGACFRAQESVTDKRDQLLRRAKGLRDLAARGMRARAFNAEAKRLEDEAAELGL